MFTRALPLLIINMGGEMTYILDQRLNAQNISDDKSKKVINDIVSTLFNQTFIDEIFKPQELYPRKSLRLLFEKIAHTSIMRLNTTSMDKLFDLMVMVFKYQISLCPCPRDILYVTLNHLEALFKFVEDNSSIANQILYVHNLFVKTYGSLHMGQYQQLRTVLLNYFQDIQIKVSVFLKNGTQLSNGRFVIISKGHIPQGSSIPGLIKVYKNSGMEESRFEVGGNYQASLENNSLDLQGPRSLELGNNIYKNVSQLLTHDVEKISSPEPLSPESPSFLLGDNNSSASFELQLLASLIGCEQNPAEFTFQLFTPEDSPDKSWTLKIGNLYSRRRFERYTSLIISTKMDNTACLAEGPEVNIVTIDASQVPVMNAYQSILNDMTISNNPEPYEEDLLELLDKASS